MNLIIDIIFIIFIQTLFSFEQLESAINACDEMDGKEFNGQNIQVYYAQGIKKCKSFLYQPTALGLSINFVFLAPGEMVRQKEAQALKQQLDSLRGGETSSVR